MVSIIQQSHCLLISTKAECSAIAFSESSVNGLPIFTYNTGGVSNFVENGKNGYMLPLGSSGQKFGKKLANAFNLENLKKCLKLQLMSIIRD